MPARMTDSTLYATKTPVRAPRFTPASGISGVPVGRLRRRSCLVVPLASGSDALFLWVWRLGGDGWVCLL